jgi:hypothetical protein
MIVLDDVITTREFVEDVMCGIGKEFFEKYNLYNKTVREVANIAFQNFGLVKHINMLFLSKNNEQMIISLAKQFSNYYEFVDGEFGVYDNVDNSSIKFKTLKDAKKYYNKVRKADFEKLEIKLDIFKIVQDSNNFKKFVGIDEEVSGFDTTIGFQVNHGLYGTNKFFHTLEEAENYQYEIVDDYYMTRIDKYSVIQKVKLKDDTFGWLTIIK